MARRGRPPEQSDEELAAAALKLQKKHPLLSEGAICGKLGRAREFLADRAKSSELLKGTRKVMTALRQAAWEEKIARGMMRGKDFNAVACIWLTRNILGWRDERRSKAPKGRPGLPDTSKEQLTALAGQIQAMIEDKS